MFECAQYNIKLEDRCTRLTGVKNGISSVCLMLNKRIVISPESGAINLLAVIAPLGYRVEIKHSTNKAH